MQANIQSLACINTKNMFENKTHDIKFRSYKKIRTIGLWNPSVKKAWFNEYIRINTVIIPDLLESLNLTTQDIARMSTTPDFHAQLSEIYLGSGI